MPTEQQRLEEVRAISHRLIALANHDKPSHSIVLEALLTAYVAVARKHRCCTYPAAIAALQAAEQLVVGTHPGITHAPGDAVHFH